MSPAIRTKRARPTTAQMLEAVRAVALHQPAFTGREVAHAARSLGFEIGDNGSLGPAYKAAEAKGWIAPTGVSVSSARSSHGLNVWKSLLYVEPE